MRGPREGHLERGCSGGGSSPSTAGSRLRAVHQEVPGREAGRTHGSSRGTEQLGTSGADCAQCPGGCLLLLADLFRGLQLSHAPFANGVVHDCQCAMAVHRALAPSAYHQGATKLAIAHIASTL